MKGTIIFCILIGWFAFLFFGYIHIVQKSMKAEDYHDPVASRKQMEDIKQRNRDLMRQQEQLMQSRKDFMRSTNRF